MLIYIYIYISMIKAISSTCRHVSNSGNCVSKTNLTCVTKQNYFLITRCTIALNFVSVLTIDLIQLSSYGKAFPTFAINVNENLIIKF